MSLDTFEFFALMSQVQIACAAVLAALGELLPAIIWLVIGTASLLGGVVSFFVESKAVVSAP